MLIQFSLSPSKGEKDIIIRPKNSWVNRARLIVDKQFLLSIRRQLFPVPENKNTKNLSRTKHYSNKFHPRRCFINRVITVVISDFSRGRIRRLRYVIARRSQVPRPPCFCVDRQTDWRTKPLGIFFRFSIWAINHWYRARLRRIGHLYTLTIIYIIHLGIMIIIIII